MMRKRLVLVVSVVMICAVFLATCPSISLANSETAKLVNTDAKTPQSTKLPPGSTTERIQLRFLNFNELLPFVLGSFDEEELRIVAWGPSYVILNSTPAMLDQAKKLISMLDTPDSLPQAIRVKLIARVTETSAGKSHTYTATTESLGTEDAPMQLNINAEKPKPQPTALRVSVTLVPLYSAASNASSEQGKTTNALRSISLTGHGTIDGEVPFRFSKEFDVATSVAPGTETVIASGSVDLGDSAVKFEVAALAKTENARVKRPLGPQPGEPGSPCIIPGQPAAPQLGPKPDGKPGTKPDRPAAAKSGTSPEAPRSVPQREEPPAN